MNIQIIIGPSVSSGPGTASPLPFFSASAGAVRNAQALPLTLTASGAAAAFCYFSAAGKVKKHELAVFISYSNAYPLTRHN